MMDTVKINSQQISALADGEVGEQEAGKIISALRIPAHHETWELYHLIGDAIRSDQMAAPVSSDFAARFAARLEAEPTVLAPAPLLQRLGKLPMTLAAIAAGCLAFVIAPQIFPGHSPFTTPSPITVASKPTAHGALLAEASQAGQLQSSTRMAEMDDYLSLHQNSHPSLYGSTQLARPARLNLESEK
jgi:sigma-E factor negative regulatory protein RseA